MAQDTLLAIDQGTSSTRTMAFSLAGAISPRSDLEHDGA